VWCQLGHWRMRGLLEVVDPGDPVASARDVDPPATDWVSYGIDIDAEHPGQYFPETQPSSAGGGQLWESISSRPLAELVATLPMRQLSPSDLFAYLSSGSAQPPVATPHTGHDAGGSGGKGDVRLPELPEAAALAGLSAAQRWDIVAALYAAATTPEWLARGAALYERDCTGCHGVSGRGDGPGAAALAQAGMQDAQHPGMAMDQSPVDFTDRAAQAGASDLLYYGKLVRGGMGTSMPYWGTLYTEDELWAVIAHLRSFAFDLPD
jgi:mono/diheme cytochrome c family protein